MVIQAGVFFCLRKYLLKKEDKTLRSYNFCMVRKEVACLFGFFSIIAKKA